MKRNEMFGALVAIAEQYEWQRYVAKCDAYEEDRAERMAPLDEIEDRFEEIVGRFSAESVPAIRRRIDAIRGRINGCCGTGYEGRIDDHLTDLRQIVGIGGDSPESIRA